MSDEWKKFIRFIMVSGIGWVIDFVIFGFLNKSGYSPFLANSISASVAVSFVFFVSSRHIFFRQDRRFLVTGFIIYITYQAISIILFSFIIGKLSELSISYLVSSAWNPVISKVIVTPITLGLNYIFMRFLTAHWNRRPETADYLRNEDGHGR